MPARPPTHASKAELRRQSSRARFARENSELLWSRLLGWSDQRLARAHLLDAVHDGSLWKQAAAGAGVPPYAAAGVLGTLAARRPKIAERLNPALLDAAVDSWLASGDEYHLQQPTPKWQTLAELCATCELGSVSALELQDDWETWIGLALASAPRVAAMDALRTAETHLASLAEITHNQDLKASSDVTRALWSALAYGDETTFKRVRAWSAEWLEMLAEKG